MGWKSRRQSRSRSWVQIPDLQVTRVHKGDSLTNLSESRQDVLGSPEGMLWMKLLPLILQT